MQKAGNVTLIIHSRDKLLCSINFRSFVYLFLLGTSSSIFFHGAASTRARFALIYSLLFTKIDVTSSTYTIFHSSIVMFDTLVHTSLVMFCLVCFLYVIWFSFYIGTKVSCMCAYLVGYT